MRHRPQLAAPVICVFACLLYVIGHAAADEPGLYRLQQLEIDTIWARASVGRHATGVVYLRLQNTGPAEDRLIGVSSAAADRAELHTHIMDGDIARMRAMDSITLAPGGTATLGPGGDHIMLMGLTDKLRQGESFTLTLRFEHAGTIDVTVPIAGIGATAPPERK